MTTDTRSEFKNWNIAAVRLLQNVVYQDDSKTWSIILDSKSNLEKHFGSLGVDLVVDEENGMAYLVQPAEEELRAGFDQVPKLLGKRRLGFDTTLMCILLRTELLGFESEDLDNTRCVLSTDHLYEQWKAYFHKQSDEHRGRAQMISALRKLIDVGFVREIPKQSSWEVRQIIKARISADELESLQTQMIEASQKLMQENSQC